MRTDDKRKQPSRLNALKSTGPKTPEGKRRSGFNSTTHNAYARNLMLPGEERAEFEELIKGHETWKPTNWIENILVTEMATTPVAGLLGHSDTLIQITRQVRRLLSLFQQLRQEILTNRQIFLPSTPEPRIRTKPIEANLTSHQQIANQTRENEFVQTEPVGTNLTEDHKIANQSTENITAQTKPVETNLTPSTSPHTSLPLETSVYNSLRYPTEPHASPLSRSPPNPHPPNLTTSQLGTRPTTLTIFKYGVSYATLSVRFDHDFLPPVGYGTIRSIRASGDRERSNQIRSS